MERLTYFENGHWRLDFNQAAVLAKVAAVPSGKCGSG